MYYIQSPTATNQINMKSSFLFLFFIPAVILAQKGVEFSANIIPCFSFIINKNDQQNAEKNQSRLSFGSTIALTAGYNFNDYLGIGSGFSLVNVRQNYIKPSTINDIEKLQHTLTRSLTYVRLPLFLRISTNPQARFSFFARLGIQGDLLVAAVGKETYPITANIANETINYRKLSRADGRPYRVYRPFVFGLHTSIGTKLRFNDQWAIVLLWHIESSISNPENDDAPLIFASEPMTIVDNYGTNEFLKRQHSWNLMTGLSLGLLYTPLSNQASLSNNKRKYRPSLWR